jgi:hypothetical protein
MLMLFVHPSHHPWFHHFNHNLFCVLLLLLPFVPGPPACFPSKLIWNYRSYKQFVGLFGRVTSPSQGHYLHRTTQTQKKRGQTSIPRVGFEPTIPVFGQAKAFHNLDRAATVIGLLIFVKSTCFDASHYVIFCLPVTFSPLGPTVFLSALFLAFG